MNKKVLIGIIAAVVVIAVIIAIVVATKGDKGDGKVNANLEEVKLPLQIDFLEKTVTATVGYPKDKGITVEDTEWDSVKIFKNEGKNYELRISLEEDTTYADNKEYAAEDDDYEYEEVTFNNFSGYLVKSDYTIEGNILLDDLGEADSFVYITFELSAIDVTLDDVETDVNELYKLDEIQQILKSIKYDNGAGTEEATKTKINEKEEKEKTSNYGEFKDRSREQGTSDKDGLIFIPSYKSPNESLYRAEQRNDNTGVDNDLWYISSDSAYTDSAIEVRIFPKAGEFENMDEYIADKGDLYHWSKQTIAGKEYDTYVFGTDSSIPQKYSKYYNGAFMVGNKVIEFSYNVFAEIPDQDYADEFFNQIMNSIEYSSEYDA